MTNTTVLYIVSDVRSGSTVFENILSKSEQIVSLGELRLLDSHIHKGKWGATWNWNCSCGKSFDDCPFWKKVYEQIGIVAPQEIKRTQLSTIPEENESHRNERQEAIKLLNKIYLAVFEISKCKVIIDSSKFPLQGLELYRNRQINFKFIHLKRDIRAVTLSKNKWNIKFFKKPLNLYKILFYSYRYRLQSNRALKKVAAKDVLNLKYEEFFENPQHHLNRIADFTGFQRIDMSEYMALENDHTVAGTPNRFERRKITFDEKWKESSRNKLIFNFVGNLLNKLS